MATQKILKLVIMIIVSVSMADNIQAGPTEPTITTTMVSQLPRQISLMPELFQDSIVESESVNNKYFFTKIRSEGTIRNIHSFSKIKAITFLCCVGCG